MPGAKRPSFREQRDTIDGLVICLPNFGDEIAISEARHPLWQLPEEFHRPGYVLGSVPGKERCFGAVKGKVQPGPMTFFRASTDDRLGAIKAYVGEGEFTSDPFGIGGGVAVTKVARLRSLLGFSRATGSSTTSQWCAAIMPGPFTRRSNAI
jgi:L-fucose isomerase-like protein